MTPFRILLSPPDVGASERQMLLEAFTSNWISTVGPDLEAFEREMATHTGTEHAVALTSGTAGLHLALQAVGVKPGTSVIVPSLTFVATANAVMYLGATPVFVDSCASTWTIDPALVQEALQRETRAGRVVAAVVSVDLYGQCADYEQLEPLCARWDVPLVEDAAEGLGATCRGRAAGAFGQAGVFSFNGNKIITTSGGGMLVTDREVVARQVRYLATQAREPVTHYEHLAVGYNYRLSNLLAALGRAQLLQLEAKVRARRAVNAFYRDALSDEAGITFMPQAPYGDPTFWLTCVLIDPVQFGATRQDVIESLEQRGIESRPAWKPMHQQPVFAGLRMYGGAVSDDVFARGLCLPSGSALTGAELEEVVAAVRSTPRQHRRAWAI